MEKFPVDTLDLAGTLDHLPVGILILDPELNLLHANSRSRSMLNLPSSSEGQFNLLAKTWDTVSDSGIPFSADEFPITKVRDTGVPCHDVVMGVALEGRPSRLWLLVNVDARPGPDGQTATIICSIQDVTSSIDAKVRSRESEQTYRGLFDGAPIGFMRIEADRTISRINSTLMSMFAMSRQDLAMDWRSFVDPEYRPRVESMLDEILAARRSSCSEQIMFRKRDGIPMWCNLTLSGMQNASGVVQSALVTVEDRSKEKQAELLRTTLYEISESAHVTDDLDALYHAIHRAISRLMPAKNFYIAMYDEEEDLIRFPYVVDEVDDSTEPIKAGNSLTDYVLRTGTPLLASPEVFEELEKSGKVKMYGAESIDWLGVPLTTREKTIGVLAVQSYDPATRFSNEDKDILSFVSDQVAMAIDRKQKEELITRYVDDLHSAKDLLEERAKELDIINAQLRSSEMSLRESNVNKDKFFSIISHDLRSPFTSVLGYSDYILNDFDTLTRTELRDLVKEIHLSAQRVFALLENLLQWSRIQTGKMKCQPVTLEIREFIDSVILLLQDQAFRKNIRLENEIPAGLNMYADQTMLSSVLQNLISNALKFTRFNGVIRMKAALVGDMVDITVQDDGVGMNPEDLEKLFRMDVHHSTQGTAKEQGTGLGLILCKELVDRNKGHIHAESIEGSGSTFHVTLPSREIATGSESRPSGGDER